MLDGRKSDWSICEEANSMLLINKHVSFSTVIVSSPLKGSR
jgi:hypothetical protein